MYYLIYANTPNDLADAVNAAIDGGAELVGGVAITIAMVDTFFVDEGQEEAETPTGKRSYVQTTTYYQAVTGNPAP